MIRFDSAGIGRSEGEVPDTIAGMALVAAELVERLGLSKIDLLGWSLGGVVAQQVALVSPISSVGSLSPARAPGRWRMVRSSIPRAAGDD